LQGILYRPILPIIVGGDAPYLSEGDLKNASWRLSWRALIQPLGSLFEKDVFVSLFFGSIVYTVWSMVTASTTNLFKSLYHLNNLQLGLAFLPNGAVPSLFCDRQKISLI
jgi:hypothetical protein